MQSFAYSLPMASFCRLVISRYTQWMVTTPTLIYVVSKISDFTRTQVATVVLCQFSVILTGLLSSVAPSPWKCEALKHVHICCCFHSQSIALISSTQNQSFHICLHVQQSEHINVTSVQSPCIILTSHTAIIHSVESITKVFPVGCHKCVA